MGYNYWITFNVRKYVRKYSCSIKYFGVVLIKYSITDISKKDTDFLIYKKMEEMMI